MNTGFVFSEEFLHHEPGPGHPECKERLIATMDHLQEQTWFDKLVRVWPRAIDEKWIATIHDYDYIRRAEASCHKGYQYLDSMDVGISAESFDVALLAAGAPVALADDIIDGKIQNGFALVRPPGHHAENDQALGFCLFNNVAILARYVQKQHGVDKVLILDWDVHHGNGTQHSSEADPSVLYISTHQYPYYPGTGAYTETGIGRGKGSVLNCPMAAGSTDEDYKLAFMEKILPKIDNFKPEFIIISAGFDAHIDDPLAQICLSTEFFGWMTERLMEKADQFAGGSIVSVLEGGYNLKMLPLCIAEHLRVLMEWRENKI